MAKKKGYIRADQCPPAKLPQYKLNQDALDLAHLALRLANAEILPPPPSDDFGRSPNPGDMAYFHHFIRAASVLLEVSKFEIEQLQLDRHCKYLKSERKGTVREDVEKVFATHATITIHTITELAGVHRIVLRSNELSSVGFPKGWKSLTTTDRRKAIYLCLTSSDYLSPVKYEETFYDLYNPSQYAEIFGNLGNRKRQANDGFQSVDDMPWEKLVDALKAAKRAREMMLKRAAGKKRHQPKPRNHLGQIVAPKK